MHFRPPFRFFLFFGPSILLSTLFQNIFNICSTVTITDQVSCPYHSYSIAHFNFYDIRRQALKKNMKSTVKIIPEFKFYNAFWFIYTYISHINSKKTSNAAIMSSVHLHIKLKAPTYALALPSRMKFNSEKKLYNWVHRQNTITCTYKRSFFLPFVFYVHSLSFFI